MTNQTLPFRATARVAGLLYLIIIGTGIFAEFFVRQPLIVAGDAAATVANLTAATSLFRLGIASDLVMLLCDVTLALLFYILLRPVNQALSLLAAFFRLMQAAVLGANVLNLFAVLQLIGGADYLAGLGAAQIEAQVLLSLEAHAIGYTIGLIFFAVNSLVFGWLVLRSGYLPKLLGILLMVAGVGYLIDSFALTLLPNYAAYAEILALVVFAPAIIGELAFCLWLLVRGIPEQPVSNTHLSTAPQAKAVGA